MLVPVLPDYWKKMLVIQQANNYYLRLLETKK